MEPQLNQFIGCDKPFDDAKVVLFGAPYDSTTSFRPGTRFGPAAMRAESFGIETYSMLQDRDLAEDTSVFDSGDIELPFGAPDAALGMIESRASEILDAGKIPFLLGGEHLVTLGSVRAVAKRYPNLHIVHFDAHADLREDYLGVKLSHACVLRRCHDILGDGRIFQFGIRSGTRDERQFMRDGHVTTELFSDSTLPEVIKKIGSDVPVYLTVDLDVLDPSEFRSFRISRHRHAGSGRVQVHSASRRLAPDLREPECGRSRQRGALSRTRSDWPIDGSCLQASSRRASLSITASSFCRCMAAGFCL